MSKNALITGANKSIGFETARRLGDWVIVFGLVPAMRGAVRVRRKLCELRVTMCASLKLPSRTTQV